jgi:bifunctional DNase/RNase
MLFLVEILFPALLHVHFASQDMFLCQPSDVVHAAVSVSVPVFVNVILRCWTSVAGTNDQVQCFCCGSGIRH